MVLGKKNNDLTAVSLEWCYRESSNHPHAGPNKSGEGKIIIYPDIWDNLE